ncbi:hypothetical protein [Allomuricauda sp. M10]|uniref:hypothetical protein n=1 Tax=Allomuricauda sp. M10 TaxID=2683292 RepID=UPI001D19878C|nr:hypothetical protein [Muricauda sp. M10]
MIDSKVVLKETVANIVESLSELEKCSINKVKEFKISSEVLFSEMNLQVIFDELSKMKGRYIYIITSRGSDKSIETIKKTYSRFDISNKPRVSNVTFNISRFNKKHHSKTLYVGTSKTICRRIVQHLGYGSKRTYSLDLIHWFPKNIDICLNIYQVSTKNHFVIELIEQAVWDMEKPLFGKRSGL